MAFTAQTQDKRVVISGMSSGNPAVIFTTSGLSSNLPSAYLSGGMDPCSAKRHV